jgi:excinuclease UvrABC nuclease subunit
MRTFRLFTLIKINRRQRFPRIYASRQIKAGVDYFGPLTTRGQFTRLKTTLERTFKLRPCLYNIRGNDPHPDCLYYQMRTCSRPCNNDIDRATYMSDVDRAIAFIEGLDTLLEAPGMEEMKRLAEEMQFEEAESVRRRLERVRRARQETKETFFSIWKFNYVAVLPADSVSRCKIAFIRQGGIAGFETYETASIEQTLPHDLDRFFLGPLQPIPRQWQYDEFCLVSNFIVDPLESVDLVRVEDLQSVTAEVRSRLERRKRKKPRVPPKTPMESV